jgi:hypothetical protein
MNPLNNTANSYSIVHTHMSVCVYMYGYIMSHSLTDQKNAIKCF